MAVDVLTAKIMNRQVSKEKQWWRRFNKNSQQHLQTRANTRDANAQKVNAQKVTVNVFWMDTCVENIANAKIVQIVKAHGFINQQGPRNFQIDIS